MNMIDGLKRLGIASGKLLCLLYGHKRSNDHRKGVGGGWATKDGGRVASKEQPSDAIAKCYYCPRCGREKRYKIKPAVPQDIQ